MSLSTPPCYPEVSYTNFSSTEFTDSLSLGAENSLLPAAKIAVANESPADETWAPVAAFLEAMQEAVSGIDEYLCVKYWNTSMARLTGVAVAEAMHRPLFSLLPRDFERHLEAGLRHLFSQRAAGKNESAEIVEGEFAQRHGNSEFFDFSYRMRVLPTTGDRGLAILTLRPAREGRRRQRRKEQPEPFGLLGQLSAGIAKALAEPLDAICSKIDNIVAIAGDSWNEPLEGELHSIITEVYRISYLVNNILTLSSPETSHTAEIDLNHLIPEAITVLEHTLNREIACVTALQEGLPPVKGDPLLLQSVLQNILRYAVEAAGEDAVPRIQTRWFTSPAANGHTNGKDSSSQVIIRVEDRGAPVAPEVLAQLFDPLPCCKRFGIAVGLGLFISKKIIESHGGQMHVSNQPGHGTIFTMALKV